MSDNPEQPEQVSTRETPKEPPPKVVTDESENAPGAVQDATAAQSADQTSETTDASATPESKPKPPRDRRTERKMRRLHKQLAAEKRRNEVNDERIARLERNIALLERNQANSGNPRPAAKPQLADFDSAEDFARAFSKWESNQATAPGTQPAATSTQQQPSQPAPTPEQDEYADFRALGEERIGADFVEASETTDWPVSPLMADYLVDSDLGPEIYTHLFNNQSVAKKVSRLKTEEKVAEHLDAIAKQITDAGTWDFDAEPGPTTTETGQQQASQPSTPAARASNAPPPPSPPDRGTTQAKPNVDEMSMDDYAAHRRAEIKKYGTPM